MEDYNKALNEKIEIMKLTIENKMKLAFEYGRLYQIQENIKTLKETK